MPIRLSPLGVLTAAILIAGCAGTAPSHEPVASAQWVTATTTRDDIRVTLTLEGPPVSAARSFVSASVENLGSRAVRWQGGGCNDPVGTFIDTADVADEGRAWPGLLGRFKTLALGLANPTNVGYEEVSRLPVPGQIPRACTADLRVNQLEPGVVLRIRAAWSGTTGESAPAPVGPATVTAWFQYIGEAGVVPADRTDADPIKVAIQTQVAPPPAGADASSAGGRQLAPALAIDAALADPQFAAWVQAAPEATWINPDVSLIEGIWSVGLFRNGPGDQTLYGAVTVAPDGTITGHRFEP